MREQPSVRIVDKTLRILRLFGESQSEWGLAPLAREADIPKTTVYRILRVLQQHDFLGQDPDSRRFRLGLGALELGRRAYEALELSRVARPVMDRMAASSRHRRESAPTTGHYRAAVTSSRRSTKRNSLACVRRA